MLDAIGRARRQLRLRGSPDSTAARESTATTQRLAAANAAGLSARFGRTFPPQLIGSLLIAEAAVDNVGYVLWCLKLAAERGVALRHAAYLAAIQACARRSRLDYALLTYKLYTDAYPDLHGRALADVAGALFPRSLPWKTVLAGVERAAGAAESGAAGDWRWRRGQADALLRLLDEPHVQRRPYALDLRPRALEVLTVEALPHATAADARAAIIGAMEANRQYYQRERAEREAKRNKTVKKLH